MEYVVWLQIPLLS